MDLQRLILEFMPIYIDVQYMQLGWYKPLKIVNTFLYAGPDEEHGERVELRVLKMTKIKIMNFDHLYKIGELLC